MEKFMTKRAYITCPLSAALAAKNFGFRFICYPTQEQIAEYESDKPWNWLHTTHENFCLEVCKIEDAIAYINEASPGKIYIAPESLHLLVPQVDDVVETHTIAKKLGWYVVTKNPCYDYPNISLSFAQDLFESLAGGKISIIQRNGLAFPAVAWEEVE